MKSNSLPHEICVHGRRAGVEWLERASDKNIIKLSVSYVILSHVFLPSSPTLLRRRKERERKSFSYAEIIIIIILSTVLKISYFG